jgi:hypothetical protein
MSSRSGNQVDSIISNFPSQPDKIRGEPDYQKLSKLFDDLKANASSVPCHLGGGVHGYLGVVLTAPAYAATIAPANTPFVVPIDPGIQAPIPVAATAAARSQLNNNYAKAVKQFKEYDTVAKALRKQIIAAVDETYIKPLKARNSGYNNVAVDAMITYLFSAYGNIDEQAIVANEKKFVEPWDGTSPFENIIERINDCVDFASRKYTHSYMIPVCTSMRAINGKNYCRPPKPTINSKSISSRHRRPTGTSNAP